MRSWVANEGGKHLVLVGEKKKFKTSRITQRICLFYLGTSRSKRVIHIVLICGYDVLCSVLEKKKGTIEVAVKSEIFLPNITNNLHSFMGLV